MYVDKIKYPTRNTECPSAARLLDIPCSVLDIGYS